MWQRCKDLETGDSFKWNNFIFLVLEQQWSALVLVPLRLAVSSSIWTEINVFSKLGFSKRKLQFDHHSTESHFKILNIPLNDLYFVFEFIINGQVNRIHWAALLVRPTEPKCLSREWTHWECCFFVCFWFTDCLKLCSNNRKQTSMEGTMESQKGHNSHVLILWSLINLYARWNLSPNQKIRPVQCTTCNTCSVWSMSIISCMQLGSGFGRTLERFHASFHDLVRVWVVNDCQLKPSLLRAQYL